MKRLLLAIAIAGIGYIAYRALRRELMFDEIDWDWQGDYSPPFIPFNESTFSNDLNDYKN